jgi:Cu/Ag efflux protein CusF
VHGDAKDKTVKKIEKKAKKKILLKKRINLETLPFLTSKFTIKL